MITPPVGMNLFVVHGIRPDKGGIEDAIWGALPYAVIMILFTLLLICAAAARDVAAGQDVTRRMKAPWRLSAAELGAAYRATRDRSAGGVRRAVWRGSGASIRRSTRSSSCDPHARAAARSRAPNASSAANALGPLDGVPVTVKDNILVAGMRLPVGQPPLRGLRSGAGRAAGRPPAGGRRGDRRQDQRARVHARGLHDQPAVRNDAQSVGHRD